MTLSFEASRSWKLMRTMSNDEDEFAGNKVAFKGKCFARLEDW